MYFNSYNFVLYFMPIALIGYYILGKYFKPAVAHMWLLAFSVLFCFSHGMTGTLILLADVVVNYFITNLMEPGAAGAVKKNKILMILGVCANILALLGLKYVGFFASVASMILRRNFTAQALVPLGISYLTFRQIGYVVDVYKGKLKLPSFLNYALYCMYFPITVQGPISNASKFIPELEKEGHTRFDANRFSKGLFWFCTGLCKKLFIADSLGHTVAWAFDNILYLTSTDIIILIFAYSFQLYFDFSGYTDMANGISEMFGITLTKNFDSPYKSLSISEIWRRWHITLTEFMREYVYFPLGGSRKGKVRTYINIIVIFLLSGFWHGVGFTYVVWGLLNGLAQCFERLFAKQLEKVNKPVRRTVTFVYWSITLLVFCSPTVKDSWTLMSGIFTRHNFSVHPEYLASASSFELDYIESHLGVLGDWLAYINVPAFFVLSAIIVFGTKNIYEKEFKPDVIKMLFCGIVLFWGIMSMGGVTTFLYAIY